MSELAPDFGPGWTVRRVRIPDPGAGVTWSQTVPGDFDWRLLAANMFFSSGPDVPARVPHLRLRDQTRELFRVPIGATIPASSNAYLNWLRGVGRGSGSTAEGMLVAPWPDMPLSAGLTLDWLCTNIVAPDAVSLITLTVLERFTGDRPPERVLRPALVEPIDLAARLGR